MKDNGYAHLSEGALVVDVKEETDTKEIPPCMILKSDGASLYNTTDLATIMERMKLYHPDELIYVVDKRQVLRAGIPLCPQDEIGRTRDRAEVLGLRYHERQGWQTLQDQTGRCYASREPDQGYPG